MRQYNVGVSVTLNCNFCCILILICDKIPNSRRENRNCRKYMFFFHFMVKTRISETEKTNVEIAVIFPSFHDEFLESSMEGRMLRLQMFLVPHRGNLRLRDRKVECSNWKRLSNPFHSMMKSSILRERKDEYSHWKRLSNSFHPMMKFSALSDKRRLLTLQTISSFAYCFEMFRRRFSSNLLCSLAQSPWLCF